MHLAWVLRRRRESSGRRFSISRLSLQTEPRASRRSRAGAPCQGDRRPGTAPPAQLHRPPAGRRGVRLSPRPAARPGAADRAPPPEGADRGPAAHARAMRAADVFRERQCPMP